MLLTIDVGNTNTVFALSKKNEIVAKWRIATNPNRTADEYGFWLRHLIQSDLKNCPPLEGAILASVVPQTQFELAQCVKQYFNTQLILVNSNLVQEFINIDIDNPYELGADRIVNALQGWHKYKTSMIIVDFGTATNFDVIDEKGTYIGGIIAPGVNLSLSALQKAAAKLPNIRIKSPEKVIGRNTISAMQSGIYYGYVEMINGLIARIKKEQGTIDKVIATGGLASLYSKNIKQIEYIEENLTIDGLISIYQLQKKD